MMQSGAIQATTETSFPRGASAPITPVHDLNVPYEATEEYATPTAEMLFPPTPVQTPLQEPVVYQYLPRGPSEPSEAGVAGDVKLGRPAPYMQQPPWMNQKPLGVDVNIAYEEGRDEEEAEIGEPPVTKDFFTLSAGKRKREDFAPSYLSGSYFPQVDGAGDTVPSSAEKPACSIETSQKLKELADWVVERGVRRSMDAHARHKERIFADGVVAAALGSEHARPSSMISQLDGGDDNYDDGVAEEDYNEPVEEEPQAANDGSLKAPKAERAESDGSEPPLNEDDDDDDLDDFDEGDEASKTEHLVVAQFEKVTRSKNKWKCILKDGVMHLNMRDYLFSKANGEFEF